LGGRKSIRPVKIWRMVEVGTDWSGWSGEQPNGLPMLIFPSTIKSRSSLQALAHLVVVVVMVVIIIIIFSSSSSYFVYSVVVTRNSSHRDKNYTKPKNGP